MDLDIDIWQGILMATLAGIVYFSVKISASFPKHNELIAVALSIGGALTSAGIFFGCCVVILL